MSPRTLGDFELRAQLGEGGFGTVYLAEQRTLERPAVVKVIRGALAIRPDVAERFLREARLASRFDHPYAAHVYAFGAEPDGVLWIAMELVRGTPLDVLIAEAAFALDRFTPLFERLCEVVQAAHDQGIVHRDLKPSNVMVLARAGRLIPKLLDFGIAKQLALAGEPPRPRTGREAWPTARGGRAPAGAATRGEPAPDDTPTAVARPGPGATVTLSVDHTVPPPVRTRGGITQAGQVLGSPPYMAPEQWLDSSTVGPAADQYALAMLAYEALAGARPFRAETPARLAEHHLHAELPALPASLPAAVHTVLARAAAKDPEQRFASLDELAAAFRAAAGLAGDAEQADGVELPAELRAAWLAEAPRPLADAVAALAAARAPGRIADRALAVGSALAHWLGILALACRARIGRPAGAGERELLRALRQRALRDEEWLELAATLTRPFAERPAAWPIPEHASFADDALRALLRGEPPGDDVARARARVAALTEVLGGLAWLLDYELARELPDGLEAWTGARSDGEAAPGPDGGMIVVNADGARVALLAPIVQALAPAPGEPLALFVLAGPGRTTEGARLVAAPGFAREVDGVWPWLAAGVFPAAAAPAGEDERSPYPGLTAFARADHASFVGREREIEDAVNRLRGQRVLAVVGPSGVGKTSFLAAGLVPGLPEGWTAALLRPGSNPAAALAACLADPAPGVRVLIVDQAEELLTISDPAGRDAFAEAVAVALGDPQLRVVFGVRDDFLCRLDDVPAWRGTLGRAVQILRVPDRDDLERIVAWPARRRGYAFDDPQLPREIADAVAERPGALPLLAFAAAALWDQRDRAFQRLTRAAYDRLGGVVGALVRHADGVVDAMPAHDRRLVRRAFGRLLTAGGTRAVLGRDALIDALGAPNTAAVVDRLIAARLIVSRDDDAGERVEIVHEALATTWPRLAAWRRDDAAVIQLHAQLAAAASHWDARGRGDGALWRGDAVAELRRRRGELALTGVEHAFAAASVAAADAARRRIRRGIAGAFVALLAEAALHGLLYVAAARRLGRGDPALDLMAARASAQVDSQVEVLASGLPAIFWVELDGPLVVGLGADGAHVLDRAHHTSVVLGDAHTAGLAGDAVITLTSQGVLAGQGRDGTRRWAVDLGGPGPWPEVTSLAVHGDLVAGVYGATVHVVRARDGAAVAALPHGVAIRTAAFDPTGARIATGDAAGTIKIWALPSGAPIATCAGHTRAIQRLAFTDDAVISASSDRDVRVCDAATGAARLRLQGHTNRVVALAVSPDGGTIASGSTDGTARLWDARTGELRATLTGHHGAIERLVFAPTGELLASAGGDGVVRLWDAAGVALGSLQGHTGRLGAVVWEPDGRHLVTGGFDGSIRRWALDRALVARSDPRHAAAIGDLQVARDGRWVVTGAADGSIAVWDTAADARRATLHSPGAITSLRLAPDGRALVSLDATGVATLWSLPDGRALGRLGGPASAVAVTARGVIATAGADHVVRLWDRAGAGRAAIAIDAAPEELVGDPSGRWLVARPRWGEAATDTTVIDVTTARVVAQLHGDRPGVATAVDASRIVTGDGNDLRVWQLGTWRPLARLVGHTGACMSVLALPDGRLVSTGNDLRVLVWSPAYALLATLPLPGIRVMSLAATADGALLVTDGADGAARVWDTTSYRALLALPSHHQALEHVAVTPDGQRLLTGGSDGRVVTWDLRRPTRTQDDLDRLVRCRVPLRLERDVALPRTLDPSAPNCQ